MTVEILGSGTSMGVPIVGCDCEVCNSTDIRDKRLRTSAIVFTHGRQILIDTSVDYRQQMLRAGIKWLDAVLYTHPHVDHILGLDDLRSLNLLHRKAIPIFGSRETLKNIKRFFWYIFDGEEKASDIPQVIPRVINEEPFHIFEVPVVPIPLFHGTMPVFGYRFGDFAFCTDVNRIPDESYSRLSHLKVLVLGALRFKPHPTHFSIDQAVAEAQKIGAEKTYLIHLTHDVSHEKTQRMLPEGIELAYDGLKITIN